MIGQLVETEHRPQHADYSFNDIVKSTEARALEVIRQAGGSVSDTEVTVPSQLPKAPKLELWNFGIPAKVWNVNDPAWQWKGKWRDVKDRQNTPARVTNIPGSEATLKFNGTGLGLMGNLSEAGGRADVYIDGVKSDLVADNYIGPNTVDDDLWRVYGLTPGEHTVRLVVRDDADSRSKGKRMMLLRAITYQTNQSDRTLAE